MAVTAAPSGRSLIGHAVASLQARAKARGVPSKVAEAVRDHTGTVTALGFMVTALWHEGPFWGWLGSGVAVLVAEFKIRG